MVTHGTWGVPRSDQGGRDRWGDPADFRATKASGIAVPDPPITLRDGGRRLWSGTAERLPEPNAAELVLLEEACRCVDLLDRLDVECRSEDLDRALVAMKEARQTAKTMQGLIAALRLPDPRTGRRPGRRPPRGVYQPRAG